MKLKERQTVVKDDCPYNNTIDESQQRSLEKAVAIFLEEQRKEREREIVKRVIKRPDISIKKGLFVFVVILAILFLLFLILSAFIESLKIQILIVLIVSVTIIFVNLRKIIVSSILVYQKLAPDGLRLSCRFEPSCSEYMLLAIEKYGILRGVGRGIKRLFRCRPPNGGEDKP